MTQAPHPPFSDPRRVLARHAGEFAGGAENAVYLGAVDRRKNLVLSFERGGERLVLKVYRDTRGYRLHTLGNPFHAHLSGGYVLRGTGPERAENEARCIGAFRACGLHVPEVVARPSADATVFRWIEGRSALDVLRDGASHEQTASLVGSLAEDLARRQEHALARGDRFLLHPHPRLTHVMIAGEARVYIDFEGVVNPRLPVEDLVALETESFLAYLARSRFTRDERILRAAVEGLGAAAFGRWRAFRPGPFWFLSGTARRRHRRIVEFDRLVPRATS